MTTDLKKDVYPLLKILEPMKPGKIKTENEKQVAKLDEIMASPLYVAEEKIDGCHYTTINNRFFSTHISTTTGVPVEKSGQVAHLQEVLNFLGMPQVILDGEIYLPNGKSNDVTSIIGCAADTAMALQTRTNEWAQFRVFDILRDEKGNWLMNEPWRVRREILERIGAKLETLTPYIQINKVVRRNKQQFLNDILNAGGEGIVLKYVDGIYQPGKRPMWNWMKVKTELDDDVVIMGFEAAERMYTGKDFTTWPYWENGDPVTKFHAMGWIGAIVFGKYVNGTLTRLGTCSGMDEAQRKAFSDNPEAYIGRVMAIKAMEKTRDGAYRHPKFIKVHSDKNPKECVA